MKLQYDPFPVIFERGNAATQLACLALFDLNNSPRGMQCQLDLIKQQRRDGAFPSRIDPEHWGTLETVRHGLTLLEAGLPPEGLNIASAVAFLLNHQNPDGGWCENPMLEIPPERIELNNERSITWVTGDIVELLYRVGMTQRKECQAALAWLANMQNQHGGWFMFTQDIADRPGSRGDPDSSAQLTFLFGTICGERDPIFQKGRELFEENLDACLQDVERGYRLRLDGARERLDAYTLTTLLLSSLVDAPRRLHSGYDAGDARVRRILQALVGIQREDGGWHTFWSAESSPVYTALAIKVLVLSGAIHADDLEVDIQPYL